MGEKEDRRVKRTEAILKDALLALLQEKPAEKMAHYAKNIIFNSYGFISEDQDMK